MSLFNQQILQQVYFACQDTLVTNYVLVKLFVIVIKKLVSPKTFLWSISQSFFGKGVAYLQKVDLKSSNFTTDKAPIHKYLKY